MLTFAGAVFMKNTNEINPTEERRLHRLGNEPTGFYAEFLTPLVGGEYDRRN